MESLQIARRIVAAYGDACFLTNLKLNLLVYWCQVEALRQSGEPLFADEISVGQCGPVEPLVWAEYATFGSVNVMNGRKPTSMSAWKASSRACSPRSAI